jgi:hypothetical protein
MPSGPYTPERPRPAPERPHTSHRQPKAGRGRLAIAAGTGAGLVGLGIAFGVGAVPVPLLSAGSASAPRASMMDTAPASAGHSLSQASASPFGYALAKMPPSPTPHHKASPTHTPSKTATPTHTAAPATRPSSQAAGSGALAPQPTAENETPTGANEKAWSEAILTSLGAPLTSANIVSIGYWMQNEAGSPPSGIVGANNPFNVSQACCGGVPIQDDGDGVTFLQSYPTVADGLEAITQYLNRGNYTLILADLKAGVGLMNDPNLASEISLYSGGGYSTIPDSWGQSQGTPES